MLIQNTSVTVNYKKIDGIKNAYINNEEKLHKYFNLGTVLPIPDNAPSPFYFMELSGHKPADTKTMYVERYSVSFHIIAEPTPSSVPTYRYIKMLEEALTDDIQIPRPYHLVEQLETGVQSIYMEQTGEKHSVVGFDFLISYGYKMKI